MPPALPEDCYLRTRPSAGLSIEMLHPEMGSACPEIWIGGVTTLSNQKTWRIAQADGWASDALHALEQL